MRVALARGAQDDLWGAVRWYDGERVGLGNDSLAAVTDALDRVVALPLAGSAIRLAGLEVRRQRTIGFPYFIMYIVADDVVRVVAVAHQRRRPGYWLGC